MQVHHSSNLQRQVLVLDVLLETSKQTEQNLQEYDRPQPEGELSASVYCVCKFVRPNLAGVSAHALPVGGCRTSLPGCACPGGSYKVMC
jgi:hypothetical protein